MEMHVTKPFVFKATLQAGQTEAACSFLASRTGMSKLKIKDAMNKGAVWIKKKGRMQRLRKATALLHASDYIELHFDGKLLALKPPVPTLISDQEHYSVWYKPAGLMAQGTMFGDHCSLLRQAELFFKGMRKTFLVHRIDREADGVMIIAHTKEAAARLSELFRKNRVEKRYRIEVLGDLAEKGESGNITLPLDGKESLTEYGGASYNRAENSSVADVIIRTGRTHQIRRHFAMIGHPVMGDPKYGQGNKNREGMKLTAVSLKFRCPFSRKDMAVTTESERI